jgi:hypothetical protein
VTKTPGQIARQEEAKEIRASSGRRKQRIAEVLGTVATLLGILTTFFSFFPHLTSSDLIQMDSTRILSFKIDITNDGLLPIFSVKSFLALKEITNKVGGGVYGGRLMDLDNCCVSRLSPGDGYTISPERLIQMSPEDLGNADFTLTVSYIPIFPPVRMNKCVHYKKHLDIGGSLHWFRSPESCHLFGPVIW